jgi:CRP-like cAMP-binding protein
MSDPEIVRALAGHSFLKGLSEAHLATLAACARSVSVPVNQYLVREGEPANAFYLIQAGRVAIEVHTPQRGSVRIQTIEPGEIVGWSWLVPPHRWQLDARAVEPVQALALDAAALRRQCEQDHELGYQLLQRLVSVISARLSATRLQLLDVYR